MKILFICGSVEPGYDGVGDYIKCLSAEIIKMGHQAAILSINDRFIQKSYVGSEQIEAAAIPLLRIPKLEILESQILLVKQWINSIEPDLISLQFVPFAFHNKGLRSGLCKYLRKIGGKRKWHIMFHELWLSRTKDAPLKHKLLSHFQQWQVRQLFLTLKPVVTHTHLPYYQSKLQMGSCEIKPLPLFSNIPPVSPVSNRREPRIFRLAFFSQVAETKDITDFINRMIERVEENHFSPVMILIGRKEEYPHLKKTLQQTSPGLKVIETTGFLNAECVSKVLRSCDLGITPVPRHLLGKSGSVAAFLSHGVPVAAPVIQKEFTRWHIGSFVNSVKKSIIINPDWKEYKLARTQVQAVAENINVSAIAKLFCTDLASCIKN